MNPRLALAFVGVAAGAAALAWGVGAWLTHALTVSIGQAR